MSTITFLLANKERRKFFFLCLLIALPIIALAVFFVSKYEGKKALEGEVTERGTNYFYRESSDLKQLPKPVADVIAKYPNGETTYLNITQLKNGNLEGSFITFTKDDLPQLAAYYKSAGTIGEMDDSKVEITKNGQHIRIEKVAIVDDDPIQNQNKIEFYFYTD